MNIDDDEKYLRNIKQTHRTAEEERCLDIMLWGKKPNPEEKEVKKVCEIGAKLEKEQLDAEAKALRSQPVCGVSQVGNHEKPMCGGELLPCAWDEGMK